MKQEGVKQKGIKLEAFIMWGLISVCVVLTGVNLFPRLNVAETPVAVVQPDITVAVSGAVNAPGTYALPWGSRVGDALAVAGGVTVEADSSLVNPADLLDTGEAVFVPTKQTAEGLARVSVNSASIAALETLPGIGPAMAQRIVEGRPYGTVEDLLDVKGIGPKTLEKLRDRVTL